MHDVATGKTSNPVQGDALPLKGARFLVFADKYQAVRGQPEEPATYLSTAAELVKAAVIAPGRFHEACAGAGLSVSEMDSLLTAQEVVVVDDLYLAAWDDEWVVVAELPNKGHESLYCGEDTTPYLWEGSPLIAKLLGNEIREIMQIALRRANHDLPINRTGIT